MCWDNTCMISEKDLVVAILRDKEGHHKYRRMSHQVYGYAELNLDRYWITLTWNCHAPFLQLAWSG